MPEFESLEQEFYWDKVRRQLGTMPREVLEQQAFFALLNMAQQKAIANELREHVDQLSKVIHALG